MTDCDEPTLGSHAVQCPQCGVAGRTVAIQTVRALVTVSLRNLEPDGYRFCANPDCAIVYYTDKHLQSISSDQIRELVYQKAAGREHTLICYCFQHTVGALRFGDGAQRTLILADIRLGIREGQCACDMRNPQGRCCLGNIQHLIQQVDASAT